jgi:hypothetical protein
MQARLPPPPHMPGMYGFAITERDGTTALQVGEAADFRRRFACYPEHPRTTSRCATTVSTSLYQAQVTNQSLAATRPLRTGPGTLPAEE